MEPNTVEIISISNEVLELLNVAGVIGAIYFIAGVVVGTCSGLAVILGVKAWK